jgi:hypothetical protein
MLYKNGRAAITAALVTIFAGFTIYAALGNAQNQEPANLNIAAAQAEAAATSGLCPIPTSPGVSVCAPTGDNSPSGPSVWFLTAARGASGAVNRTEIWIDGIKKRQVFSNQVNTQIPLAVGSHRAVIVEVDTAGHFIKSFPISFLVQSSNTCAAPTEPGVHVCTPSPNECFLNGALFDATGKAANGTVCRMELWINGRKFVNFAGNQVNTSLFVAIPGTGTSATVTIVEVDSTGAFIKSAPVTFHPAC